MHGSGPAWCLVLVIIGSFLDITSVWAEHQAKEAPAPPLAVAISPVIPGPRPVRYGGRRGVSGLPGLRCPDSTGHSQSDLRRSNSPPHLWEARPNAGEPFCRVKEFLTGPLICPSYVMGRGAGRFYDVVLISVEQSEKLPLFGLGDPVLCHRRRFRALESRRSPETRSHEASPNTDSTV